jgi:hypothetical protein
MYYISGLVLYVHDSSPRKNKQNSTIERNRRTDSTDGQAQRIDG